MYIVFKINVLLLSLIFIEIRYFIIEMTIAFYSISFYLIRVCMAEEPPRGAMQ